MDLALNELEGAINFWRARQPSTGEERALSKEVNVLADIYAQLIYTRARTVALESISQEARDLIIAWQKDQSA